MFYPGTVHGERQLTGEPVEFTWKTAVAAETRQVIVRLDGLPVSLTVAASPWTFTAASVAAGVNGKCGMRAWYFCHLSPLPAARHSPGRVPQRVGLGRTSRGLKAR